MISVDFSFDFSQLLAYHESDTRTNSFLTSSGKKYNKKRSWCKVGEPVLWRWPLLCSWVFPFLNWIKDYTYFSFPKQWVKLHKLLILFLGTDEEIKLSVQAFLYFCLYKISLAWLDQGRGYFIFTRAGELAQRGRKHVASALSPGLNYLLSLVKHFKPKTPGSDRLRLPSPDFY